MPSSGTRSFSSPISHENRVDILVDRTDNVANVHALQRLAQSCPTVLTVAIPPGVTMPPGTGVGTAEILWALGKRASTRWKDPSPHQGYADIWLEANQIRELVILQAQHLPANALAQLREWAEMRDLDLALLYCGTGSHGQPTTTIEAFLGRPRRPTAAESPPVEWPRIETVKLLDFRTQCFCQLTGAEYLRVDRAFHGTATRIGWFFDGWAQASRDELGRAVALAAATHDDHLRDILEKGALVGLLRHGRALPDPPPAGPPFEPHTITQQLRDELLEDINPWRAAVRFLRHWTHLSDRQLAVLGPEQVTAATVAGIEFPAEMRPIIRAVIRNAASDYPWSPFSGGVWVSTQRWDAPETDPPISDADKPGSEASYTDPPELVARILSSALTGPFRRGHWAISRQRIPASVRQDIQDLRQRGILDGIYPHEYELTTKAISDSHAVSTTHLNEDASPEEILLFLIKHRHHELPKYRDATSSQGRMHSRLVLLLANLVTRGHTGPYDARGYLRIALEDLREAGYVANFGPFGYRLSDRGVYSLCWDERLPVYPKDIRDCNPPPSKLPLDGASPV